MILEIKNSIQDYEDLINDFLNDECFSDPHYMYDKDKLYSALKKKNQKAYAVFEKNTVKGLFIWLILPNEKYIEMIIGLSRTESVIEEMISFIEKAHLGYKFDFVINPKNEAFKSVLNKRNASFDSEQQKMVWCRDVTIKNLPYVELLTSKYEHQYKNIHNEDVYWTSEKILNAKEKFRVYVAIKDEEVIGYLDVTYCYKKNEPYYLFVKEEYLNLGYEHALLSEAIKNNKPNGVMVLVDVDSTNEIKIYEDVGFRKVAKQNCIYATFKS